MVVNVGSCRVWPLVHRLLVWNHVLWARRDNSHRQAVWVTMRMRREVAVLSVLWARIRVVVEERRLTHRWGGLCSVFHCE